MLEISIVIPVRNRKDSLKTCLASIYRQSCLENFEIIIVDDGGTENPLELPIVKNLSCKTKIVRQAPLGISQARNRGIEASSGEVILFIDSDCTLEKDCLKNLRHFLDQNPQCMAYQLRLIGSKNSNSCLMEHLRISAAQICLLNKDSSIKYVNTAGFAIRKAALNPAGCFNAGAVRGEDTFLLAELIESGNLPRFVSNAVVKHSPSHSAVKYMLRHFFIGYHANAARQRVGKNKNVLMGSSKKYQLLKEMRNISSAEKISSVYIIMVLFSYVLELLGAPQTVFGIKHDRVGILSVFVDRFSETELITTVISHAQQRKGFFVTYLTAWTLAQSEQLTYLRKVLNSFNVCYADGMGTSLTLLLTRYKWTPKVTVNDFFDIVLEEISNRGLKAAFIGGKENVLSQCIGHIRKKFPAIEIPVCAPGYFTLAERRKLNEDLLRANPHIVFLAMGQPRQEKLAFNLRKKLPNTVFWCVGGLLDYVSGHNPTPPKWIRKCGLEWIVRLLHSPKYMAKRYLWGLPVLFAYIVRYNFRKITFRSIS